MSSKKYFGKTYAQWKSELTNRDGDVFIQHGKPEASLVESIASTHKINEQLPSIIELFGKNTLGHILTGSMAYAPNFNVRQDSDVDIIFVTEQIDEETVNKPPFDFSDIEMIRRFNSGEIGEAKIKRIVNGVEFSIHYHSKKIFDVVCHFDYVNANNSDNKPPTIAGFRAEKRKLGTKYWGFTFDEQRVDYDVPFEETLTGGENIQIPSCVVSQNGELVISLLVDKYLTSFPQQQGYISFGLSRLKDSILARMEKERKENLHSNPSITKGSKRHHFFTNSFADQLANNLANNQ